MKNLKGIYIESKIRPFVDALNDIGILQTFSSCQGHYSENEQEFQDRNMADVRFDPDENCPRLDIESFLNFLIVEFNNRCSPEPITLKAFKLYSPNSEGRTPDYVYVIQLRPFKRFDCPDKKRQDTDRAILQATEIVNRYSSNKQNKLYGKHGKYH